MSYSDDEQDDALGPSLGLGLGGVLQEAGVDISAFSSFFGASEAGPSGTSGQDGDAAARFAQIEGEGEGRYMDDDDDDLNDLRDLAGGAGEYGAENEAEAREKAKERERAEQEMWMAKGLEIQREAEQKAAAKRRKMQADRESGESKEESPLDIVRKSWPGWQVGDRLRMSQVFYQTPVMAEKERREGVKRKRRHFGYEDLAEGEEPPEPRKCE